MNLIASYKKNGKPQRQLLTHEGITYRRIFFSVNQDGSFSKEHNPPWWQEQIHNGDFHNVSADKAEKLEMHATQEAE